MSTTHDALIIGGGPAGLSSAIAMARQGLKVAVFEKQSFPVDKPCGQGIMPTGVALLKDLGVSNHLKTDDFFRFKGIHYVSHKGKSAQGQFAEGDGWSMRREVLSKAFFDRANDFPNIDLFPETKINKIVEKTDSMHVSSDAGEHSGRLILGADGLKSFVRKHFYMEGLKQSRQRYGIRKHFKMTPWNDKVEVYWGKGMEAYITPCSNDIVEVAFLWEPAKCGKLEAGKKLFDSILEYFPLLKEKLTGIDSLNDAKATGPFHRLSVTPVRKGVLLIGDAAGYLDAITGEGISLALDQAKALEEKVCPLFKKKKDGLVFSNQAEMKPYFDSYKKIVKPYYNLTGLVLKLSDHPFLVERAVNALSKNPDVFQHMLSANMGKVSPFSLKVPSLARMARDIALS